jgi:hypothetical protein
MKIKCLSFLFIFTILLVACSKENLTRVDVQKVNKEGDYEATLTIINKETIDLLQNSFEKVNWDPNTKVEMARREDILATLFYTFDEDQPERLYEYRIWFNGKGTATIISNNEKEGYGILDKDNAEKLKKGLLN